MSSPAETVTRLLRIHGLVQGVCYRESMRQEAQQLGVTGWVRNRRDGTVEALVQGTPRSVDAIVDWCGRGPEHAQVTSVETVGDSAEAIPSQRFDDFRTLPTY
jgi:acylphosphatase